MSEMRRIETLRLHPDAERVPLASSADLATLRSSLEERGQQDPIDITPDGVILDGRTRWTLLKELGFDGVEVRVVDVPEGRQTHYIVDRALARRHLTAEQKQALNEILKETVVEEVQHPETGEQITVGLGPTQRARILGVGRETVRRWDRTEAGAPNDAPAPTHYRREGGQLQPLHPDRSPAPKRPLVRVVKAKNRTPLWLPLFTKWVRRTRPEDRDFLLRMDAQIHTALETNEIPCSHSEGSDSGHRTAQAS